MYFNGLWYTYKTRVTQRSTEPCVTAALSTFTQSVVRADGLQNKEYQWKTLKIASKNKYKKYIHLKHHIMLEADSIIYKMAAMSMMTKNTLKINVAVFDLRESTLVVLTPFWFMQVFSDRWQSQTAPEYSEVHTHFPQEQFPWAGP